MYKKICTKCKLEKELSEFPLKSYLKKDGSRPYHSHCKACMAKSWYKFVDEKKRKLQEDGKLICVSCKIEKPQSFFTTNSIKCKECISITNKNRKIEHKRQNNLFYTRKISYKQYNELLALQNFKCAICEHPHSEEKRKGLVVDHCHKTGKIRGLLCHGCNTGLGRFGDNIEGLQNAIEYIKKSIS